MDVNEKAAKAVEEFIRTATSAQVVEAARRASPHSFEQAASAHPSAASVGRNGASKLNGTKK